MHKIIVETRQIVSCSRCTDGIRHRVGNCIFCGCGPGPGGREEYTYPAKESEKPERILALYTEVLRSHFAPKVKLVYEATVDQQVFGPAVLRRYFEN